MNLPEPAGRDTESPSRHLVMHCRCAARGSAGDRRGGVHACRDVDAAPFRRGDDDQPLARGGCCDRLDHFGARPAVRLDADPLDVGMRDQAPVDGLDLAAAMPVQPDDTVAAHGELDARTPAQRRPGCQDGAHTVTASPAAERSTPPMRRSCSRRTSAFIRRCRAGVTCCQSQPPQRPGPAYGHGGTTRSGEAASTSTASARQNRLARAVTRAWTRSPGNACRTKMTRPSWRATQLPPGATGPTSSSIRSPGDGCATGAR